MADITFNYVKFMRGTPEAYENLAVKANDTLYFVLNTGDAVGKLYLGETLIAGGASEESIVKYLRKKFNNDIRIV